MDDNKQVEFLRYITGSDMDFYEQFLKNLSVEELQHFLDCNPDFLSE